MSTARTALFNLWWAIRPLIMGDGRHAKCFDVYFAKCSSSSCDGEWWSDKKMPPECPVCGSAWRRE